MKSTEGESERERERSRRTQMRSSLLITSLLIQRGRPVGEQTNLIGQYVHARVPLRVRLCSIFRSPRNETLTWNAVFLMWQEWSMYTVLHKLVFYFTCIKCTQFCFPVSIFGHYAIAFSTKDTSSVGLHLGKNVSIKRYLTQTCRHLFTLMTFQSCVSSVFFH